MLWVFLLLSAAAPLASAGTSPTAPDLATLIAEVGKQADLFERNAYRITAVETLHQTVPRGVRTGVNKRGVVVGLPGIDREIVSEYGFLTEDVRGGSLREVRMVQSIDGLTWKRGTRSLASLRKELAAARDENGRRKLLEAWEDYGLSGFVTDLGQLLLLFARGGASLYDIEVVGSEGTGADALWVLNYRQKSGAAALTVYGEGAKPVRQSLAGKLWVRKDDRLPVRMSLESKRRDGKGEIEDIATVSYFLTPYGTLMPIRILHQQHGDGQLLVTNEFTYSGFRQVLAPAKPR